MQEPPVPHDEPQRLQALRDLEMLDTAAEERFDRLTRLARQMFGVPVALVSLVDEKRQWFKSRQGLDACETGRDISFCGHAILGRDIFEVGDASKDPRFADNPLVTGVPHVRFYAGAPLIIGNGHGIGTLCIIDSQPRQLDADERRALRDLADIVASEIDQIEQRRQSEDLKAARKLAEVIARAQSQFIRENDRRRAFDDLLSDILDLTGSEYGFVGEVLRTADGAPYLKTYAITNIAWDNETRAFYEANAPQGMEFLNLKTLFGAALSSGEPVIANDPYQDPRRGGLPDGHPALNAFLGIPVRYGADLVAMLGLANRTGGYDQGLIDFLSPLLATLGQLVATAQAQQRHHEDQLLLARLSRVASETTNGVIITGIDGRVEWINEGLTRITGYTLDDMLGRKPGELLQGPDTDQATVAEMRSALSQGQGFNVEVLNYTRDGRPYWVRVLCNPLRDEKDMLQGFMAIELDMTEARQATDALQASESRLRGLFELSPFGIALIDYATGTFLDVNAALLRDTGYSREEFSALTSWALTAKEYETQDLQHLEKLEKTGRYGPVEKKYTRKDRSCYPALLNGIAVHDSGGRKLVWLRIEDISERNRVDRMKSEFISTVSHELRTPLTSISAALSLVVGGVTGEIPDKMREMLTIAHKNSGRLGLLIDDLLDMEKLVAGKVRFDLQVHPLQPLLEQAIQENQAYADRFSVHLRVARGAGDTFVKVDARRVQQVLANLLSNAAKFSPEGGEVTILAATGKGRVRVSVTDRGPGIPEDFESRMFEKFAQADASDARRQGGSGLGLAITRELVERMGGNVGFDSVPDQGATFWFEFTAATANDPS